MKATSVEPPVHNGPANIAQFPKENKAEFGWLDSSVLARPADKNCRGSRTFPRCSLQLLSQISPKEKTNGTQ